MEISNNWISFKFLLFHLIYYISPEFSFLISFAFLSDTIFFPISFSSCSFAETDLKYSYSDLPDDFVFYKFSKELRSAEGEVLQKKSTHENFFPEKAGTRCDARLLGADSLI